MPQVNLDTYEARLVGIARAIKELEHPELIDSSDVGPALDALESTFDLEKKESDLSAKEMRSLLLGFVGGLGAATGPQPQFADEPLLYGYPLEEEEEGEFVGGPTGGAALQQGEDDRFVNQSGVHEGQNDG